MTLLQASLFDSIPLSIPSDNHVALAKQAPPTSVEAARRVMPASGTQRWRILWSVVQDQAATDAELAERTGIKLQSVCPRRNELVEQGWLEDSGQRRSHGSSGPGIVWQVTDEGWKALGKWWTE